MVTGTEGGAAHPRVPAGRLRRGGRARRVPGARAGAAWSTSPCTARARPRSARGRAPAVGRADSDAGRSRFVLDRPVHGGRGRGGGPGALATPGTRTWPAISRRCCTASRTSPPCTRWSRCGRGRPSSSAAATRCRPGPSGWLAAAAAAVVAVSDGMRADISRRLPRRFRPNECRVIRNGIDTAEYAPDPGTEVLDRHGIDPSRPVRHLRRPDHQAEGPARAAAGGRGARARRAARALRRRGGHAGARAPRCPALVSGLQETRSGVIWIPDMLPKPEVIQLLTHALVFVCPSVYEPLGIVNLEAMACAHRGRRLAGRRHPRGRRRRRDRAARPAGRPGVAGRRAEPPGARPRARGGDGPRRPANGRSPSSAGTRSPRRRWRCMRS